MAFQKNKRNPSANPDILIPANEFRQPTTRLKSYKQTK